MPENEKDLRNKAQTKKKLGKMPKLDTVKNLWAEECDFVEELEQQGDRRNEAESIGTEKCKHVAYGSTGEECLSALRMHVDGRHRREVEFRNERVRRQKMEEERQVRKEINDEKIAMLKLEAEMQVERVKLIKEEEKKGEAEIGGMLKSLNENRAHRGHDGLKVESVLTKEREFPSWSQKQDYESWFLDYKEYLENFKARRRIEGELSKDQKNEVKSKMFKMLAMTTTFDEARDYFNEAIVNLSLIHI